MLIKIIGLILILFGVAGLILPVIPGIILIVVGGLLLFEEKLHMIKERLPEKFPSPVAVFYNYFIPKIFRPYFTEIINEVIQYKKGISILDVGCGPGTIAISLVRGDPGYKVTGIDLSEKMIELAEKNRSASGLGENPSFIKMSAEKMDIPDNSADLIMSTMAFHLMKSPEKVLTEIYRVLKDGGEAWIYDGYGSATLGDVRAATDRWQGIFPPASLLRCIIKIEGYTEGEYHGKVDKLISESPFHSALFERKGIMMKITMKKAPVAQ